MKNAALVVVAAAAALMAWSALAQSAMCEDDAGIATISSNGARPTICTTLGNDYLRVQIALKIDASASVNFTSIAAGDCNTATSSPAALAGVPTGTLVTCGISSDLTGNTTAPMCWVSSPGTVSIKVCNANLLAPVYPPATTFLFRVHL